MEGAHLVEMLNNKVNDLDDKGCRYGALTRQDLERVIKDINGMGKKVGNLYNLGWAILLVLFGILGKLALK